MADVSQSFLDKKPTLDELCEYIVIGVKWYQLGIQLKLNLKLLCVIDEQPREITYKTSKTFELWLDTNPHASRIHIVEASKKEVIGETSLADYYVKTLMESALKEKALKGYLTELSQYLSCPVKVAQLLFSERCINKIALEKMETLEDSLDEKKTTLLSAIHAIVSSNHCTERQQEIETLQKIVTLLMLKLDERDKQIEEMKRSWKDLAFLSKAREPVSSDQGLEVETSTD